MYAGVGAKTALLPRRPEYVIPKRRADAITNVIIVVMVPKMVLLQPKPNSTLHRKMVNSVMDRIVTDVTEAEPGRHSRGKAAQSYGEQTPEKNR